MKKILINILIIIGAIVYFVVPIIMYLCNDKIIYNTTPVKEIRIDTLYIVRDSIINKVEYIKTIEYDTIEKIYNLDDSSSIKLFYELVSE